MLPKVISVSGKALAGKDTTVNYIKEYLENKGKKVKVYSHAYPIKKMLIEIFGFTEEQIFDQNHKTDINEEWGMSGRQAMIIIGTEMFRNIFHPNTWVILMRKAIERSKYDYILIQDCRFKNEFESLKSLDAHFINIVRDKKYLSKWYKTIASFFYNNQWLYHILSKLKLVSFRWHKSETFNVDPYVDKQIINDGSLDDLKKQVIAAVSNI